MEVLAKLADYDILLNALVGFVGLNPTLTAINKGKDIALANKECLVVAGEFVMEACCRNNVRLLPVDSEHSAIFQALQGNDYKKIKRIILTASGGSFRDYSRDMLQHVSKEETLQHPNWQMGAKITVDSATMMNKGFEVIEAHWLFGIDYDDIEVVMHRESIVHSLVEYIDNSIIAQMGIPDMRLPIQYALSYPQRLPLPQVEGYDFKNRISLSFEPIDFQRYPLLGLAYEVGQKKGNLPAIMNAANEEAVAAFLNDQISFLEIEEYVISACRELDYQKDVILNDVFTADQKARKYVRERIKGD